jgi:hypothetical protein
MVADSFFAKSEAVKTTTALGVHFISRLRDDAVLFYLNREPKTNKRGAPKKYAGRVKPGEPYDSLIAIPLPLGKLDLRFFKEFIITALVAS